jgi:hypothetical protein
MSITINGSGTVTGISAGGLPDDCITTADIAANAVTIAKLGSNEASGLCKAWVNFNGTSTVAIRAQYNVSSITDNGTGDYTVNFTTALVDANYSVSGSAVLQASSATPRIMAPAGTNGFSASNCQIRTANDIGNLDDCAAVSVSIFR